MKIVFIFAISTFFRSVITVNATSLVVLVDNNANNDDDDVKKEMK